MMNYSVSEARAKLYRLVDETSSSHKPIFISGKRSEAVLVSAEDWAAIQETLYLLNIPGMRESLLDGKDASVDECSKELDW